MYAVCTCYPVTENREFLISATSAAQKQLRCMCILSHCPFVDVHRAILLHLWRHVHCSTQIPLERVLKLIFQELPHMPLNSKVCLIWYLLYDSRLVQMSISLGTARSIVAERPGATELQPCHVRHNVLISRRII